MSDLPIRMNIMPPCLCESKVIGYEYNEDGFNITHCACGGVITCEEIEDVEVKKPFDITKHEFSDSRFYFDLDVSEGVALVDGEINKADTIAIAKALGVTGEDLK